MMIHTCLRRGVVLAVAALTVGASAVPSPDKVNSQPPIATPTQITYFGERAAFSADGKKLAFVDQSYGDAFEMDLATKHITLLTHYPNPGYLRVQYLNNGNAFLIGANTYKGVDYTREALQEMWVLKPGTVTPVRLGQKILEGVAISRMKGSTKIAWANGHENYPNRIAENQTIIYTADVIDNADGKPTLTNIQEVLRANGKECSLEPQDFFMDDTQLTYTCYVVNTDPGIARVRGINLKTGKVTEYRYVAGQYNEVEGITPDGKYTMVESGKDQPAAGGDNVDIWRLRLKPHSTDFVRVTDFADNPVNGANKSSNPVVSPDGKTMAFQAARGGDAAGVGYGIFLVDLPPEGDEY